MPGMGTKRSFKEVDASTPEEGLEDGGQMKKQKRKEDNINWVKKRARDIERIFKRDNSKLPANVQKDLERELAAHRNRIAEEKDRKLKVKMIGKYRMVRFFERKKAMRLSKQLQGQLEKATDPAEIETLKADMHIAEVDVNYTNYFPLMEPYVSMYKVTTADKPDDKSTAQLALRSERPPLWPTVEKAMEEGQEALERLRDRHPDADAKPPAQPASKQPPPGKAKAKDSRETKPNKASGSKTRASGPRSKAHNNIKPEESSDSEGGGFFENA